MDMSHRVESSEEVWDGGEAKSWNSFSSIVSRSVGGRENDEKTFFKQFCSQHDNHNPKPVPPERVPASSGPSPPPASFNQCLFSQMLVLLN